MSSLQLLWIGDLESGARHSSEHLRPRRIEISPTQQEAKFGRENTKNPPDYNLESTVNNRMVSRRHAVIERDSSNNFILYDHSLNGTYVNYKRVAESQVLKTGDIICFGHLNGANIKPGAVVSPYHSDLKYKVEIVEKDTSSEKKKKNPLKSGVKRDSSVYDESSDSDKKKKSSKKAWSSHSNSSSSSGLSSDDDDRESKNKTVRASITSTKSGVKSKENGAKRRALDKSSKPRASGDKSSAKKTAGKAGKSKGSSAAQVSSTSEMFHYGDEECSANPCRRPDDLSIDWIQCDKCSKWYHMVCVGLGPDDGPDDNDIYYCPKCKNK